MPNSDTLALNDNGTLKDATELEWLNSPSDESHPIFLTNQKCKRILVHPVWFTVWKKWLRTELN